MPYDIDENNIGTVVSGNPDKGEYAQVIEHLIYDRHSGEFTMENDPVNARWWILGVSGKNQECVGYYDKKTLEFKALKESKLEQALREPELESLASEFQN